MQLACFNPFSFRSPSKRSNRGIKKAYRVSIPSPSGLLQNPGGFHVAPWARFNPFSFRSPSKREAAIESWLYRMFQSLLLQVSFKTIDGQDIKILPSVSIPSPSGLLQNTRLQTFVEVLCFNPFSFRSPSKRSRGRFWQASPVSIPSPSGLLQNRMRLQHEETHTVSIPSPSGLLQNFGRTGNQAVRPGFNPFSFRSPSKRLLIVIQRKKTLFQSLLLQVSFKTRTLERLQNEVFQSLLLQVSFKTAGRPGGRA